MSERLESKEMTVEDQYKHLGIRHHYEYDCNTTHMKRIRKLSQIIGYLLWQFLIINFPLLDMVDTTLARTITYFLPSYIKVLKRNPCTVLYDRK